MRTNTERSRDWREKRRAMGLCIGCPNPSLQGKLRCEDCAEDNDRTASLSRTRKILAAQTGGRE